MTNYEKKEVFIEHIKGKKVEYIFEEEIKIQYKSDFFDQENNYYYDDSFLNQNNSHKEYYHFDNEEVWFENNNYLISSSAIYKKILFEGNNLLVRINNFPLIPTAIFVVNNTRYCKIKYKTVGKIKVEAEETDDDIIKMNNKNLYNESTIQVSELNNTKANKNSTPEHLKKGWMAPQKYIGEIRALLEFLLTESKLISAFRETGWQYDNILKKKVFVTTENNQYVGFQNGFLETAGTFDLWKKGMIIVCRASNRTAHFLNMFFGSLLQGNIQSNNSYNPTIYIVGEKGSGKSLEQTYLSTFFHSPNPGISGVSTFSGTEKLLIVRNNTVQQFDEMDAYLVKDENKSVKVAEIERMLALQNGSTRAYMKNKDEVNDSKFRLVLIGTGNRDLQPLLEKDDKGQAVLDRMMIFKQDDQEIRPLPKGTKKVTLDDGTTKTVNIFNNDEAWLLLNNNYGWGFKKAIEVISNNQEYWTNIFYKTKTEIESYYKDKTNFKEGNEGSDRQLYYITLASVGNQIMREVIEDEQSYEQAQSVIEILLSRLIENKVEKDPRISAIKTISKLISLISLNKKNVVWKNYAWSESCSSQNAVMSRNTQLDTAEGLNNSRGNNNINCIVSQTGPFKEEYDFNGEILIPFSNEILKFGQEKISIQEIKNACDILDLWKKREVKGRNTKRVERTKQAGAKERAFFPFEENLLRIEINFLELYKEYALYEQKRFEEENSFEEENEDEVQEDMNEVSSIVDFRIKKEKNKVTKEDDIEVKTKKKKEISAFMNIYNK